ncbi:MAG: tubulin-like doman-containing protein [Oscillospiraceae bacterium]
MPKYDSLLLNCGGGIINRSQQSKQYRGAAALAIGIGGTGVAALAELKQKVYQQLEPDDPDSPVPEYQHIQFLAIDSDTTDIDQMRGMARLDREREFFSINNPNLAAALRAKKLIEVDASLNWMDIDHIDGLLSTQGAGGVRQVGRYLLISRASNLISIIQAKCTQALEGMTGSELDVYIFAGISGGTGSGCFLDTCYIVQKALENMRKAQSANVMGFFFLPDVVTSKPQVAADPVKVNYNSSNGYAAMKELDYLMSLKDADDWFRQNYGTFKIETQEPPVQMCHLISATKSDGSLVPNGFQYCINVAADYVMAYLADVELPATNRNATDGSSTPTTEYGLTMRGHLANVGGGVSGLPRMRGANLSYHILGAANAEIPMTQISTYLAAGFMRRFKETVGKDQLNLRLSQDAVSDWVDQIGLTAQQVYNDVTHGCPDLMLPDIDLEDLRTFGIQPHGQAPRPWDTAARNWCTRCEGQRGRNRAALEGELPKSLLDEDATDDSLIGRTFRKLCDIAKNPELGPYYAAFLLSRNGNDLKAAVEGAIQEIQGRKRDEQSYLDSAADRIVQASTNFCANRFFGIGDKRAYNDYVDSVKEYYRTYNRVQECTDVENTLRRFREQLENLNSGYFALLTEVLDNLLETFEEDEQWLDSSAASASPGYTKRILQLSDVKPKLDKAIKELNAKQLVQDFMEYLMKAPEEWSTRDDGKIGLYISEFMVKIFQAQTDRSLEDYLYEKYPKTGHNSAQLAQAVSDDILDGVYNDAKPMFWCSQTFPLGQGNNTVTFDSSSLSVPANASAVCSAAQQFGAAHNEFFVRRTGLKNRIFALRFCSGVPLYAYAGMSQMKKSYDENRTTKSGVGAHLYAYTGRGEDDSGFHDWRNFLPVPIPYSYSPDLVDRAQELLALYDEGVKKQIIYTSDGQNYFVRQSAPQDIAEYKPEEFTVNGRLDADRLQKEKKRLQDLLTGMYDPANGGRQVELKNDGAVYAGPACVDRVRKDYFMHYPMLQRIVRQELEKQEKIRRAMEQLDQIEREYSAS